MILNSFYAFLSSLGFGVLFNIRGKNLIIASLGGGLAWLTYLISGRLQPSLVFSLFLASMVGSIYSEIMARLYKNPVTMFVICAIIPLVPGGGMYYATLEAVKGNFTVALTKGAETLFSAGAIAVGIVFVASISTIFKKIKK
ncbi:threonine/serine exporter family protein [Clostridium estertheticum]|uniref:Threonine/serine exporter family protein n=1 Tax=Clostridium estertheticum TaxID=238834 RepID=A0A7Y3SW48_9CLOT|nr:threonine/serine exporter family protein [Clostridium estertheticum]MBW9171108.1 threonine/serine exporter family protein [Clostridium estertheticum]MBX4266064.1 threonine/serine exporter family protein [Clostridium estertheticum]MCB2306109.1 threonine/serine exporter family protein [Clostridium estertheticum]MCB2344282.1 threonine/serine exporter family protein [Clostridium estertheticum]MCB2349202.1 threonine/serine exporter family protein [Clostridium estertheticum]